MSYNACCAKEASGHCASRVRCCGIETTCIHHVIAACYTLQREANNHTSQFVYVCLSETLKYGADRRAKQTPGLAVYSKSPY